MPEVTYNEHMMYGIVAIAWLLAFANVIKYVIRYHEKGGIVDLQKARWYLERLIDQANADG